MSALPGTVGVVGLGLMGASFAMGVRRVRPGVRLLAVEPRAEVRERALRERVVDEAFAAPEAALATCGLAILCTPVAGIEGLLEPVSRLLPAGAILTDVGGAKERVVKLARERVRAGVAFVGAHPMFGGTGGYAGASADKWMGARWRSAPTGRRLRSRPWRSCTPRSAPASSAAARPSTTRRWP